MAETLEDAQLVDAARDGDDWLHEIKYDGYRMMARLVDGADSHAAHMGVLKSRGLDHHSPCFRSEV